MLDEKVLNDKAESQDDIKEQSKTTETSLAVDGEAKENTETNEKTEKVEFGKTYKFEGREYDEIDLSGVKNLKVDDAIKVQHELFGEDNIATAILTERSSAFAREIVTLGTGLPEEFFKLMPLGIWKRTQRAVFRIVSDGGESDNHIMRFKNPYTFEGKTWREVDMSGLEMLTSMNESEAENRLMRENVITVEPAHNFLYACIMASMATGLPEEFFRGLPICELTNLKTEANDFFE